MTSVHAQIMGQKVNGWLRLFEFLVAYKYIIQTPWMEMGGAIVANNAPLVSIHSAICPYEAEVCRQKLKKYIVNIAKEFCLKNAINARAILWPKL